MPIPNVINSSYSYSADRDTLSIELQIWFKVVHYAYGWSLWVSAIGTTAAEIHYEGEEYRAENYPLGTRLTLAMDTGKATIETPVWWATRYE